MLPLDVYLSALTSNKKGECVAAANNVLNGLPTMTTMLVYGEH